jgi:hypothetical protein
MLRTKLYKVALLQLWVAFNLVHCRRNPAEGQNLLKVAHSKIRHPYHTHAHREREREGIMNAAVKKTRTTKMGTRKRNNLTQEQEQDKVEEKDTR